MSYLGLPLLTNQMRVTDYFPLLEKIRGQVNRWTTRNLSFAGRLQLIGSVFNSTINFWGSAFRLPSGCIKEVERICSAFLWSGPVLNPRKAKISWPAVCCLKEEGGLGLRNLREINKVMCFKLIWRLLSADSLWAVWIRSNLLQGHSFWSECVSKVKGSWMWRKLLKYRNMARDFHKVKVVNGELTHFWHDSWCSVGRLWGLAGCRSGIDFGIPEKAIMAAIPSSRRRRDHRLEILNTVEEELSQHIAAREQGRDIHLWRNHRDEFRSRFSTSETLLQIRQSKPRVSWHQGVWFRHCTPKYSFITWLAVKNRLSTGDRMAAWGPNVNTNCVLCGDFLETREHLFFNCSYGKVVWRRLVKGVLKRDYSEDWNVLLGMISANQGSQFLFRYLFQTTLYHIWQERNRRKHGGTPIQENGMIKIVDLTVRNRINSVRRVDRKMEGMMMDWFKCLSTS